MDYTIEFLTEDGEIQFAQGGECQNRVEALNRAWYFLGFSNAPGLRLYVFPNGYKSERSGKLVATLRPLAKGSTAEREKGRDGSLKDWIDLFREDESAPPSALSFTSGDYSDGGITDADIPF